MLLCHRGSTCFALFAGEASVPEVGAVEVGEFCSIGWVGAECAKFIG